MWFVQPSLGLLVGITWIAQAPSPTTTTTAPATAGSYKVAFWYDADRPRTSIRYQVYDLGKGEYNEKAVKQWFQAILDHDPTHGAYIREIQTAGLPGATEADRLAHALATEKERWDALHRRPSLPLPRLSEEVSRPPGLTPAIRPLPGSPGRPGVVANPPRSPFPYPYRSGPR